MEGVGITDGDRQTWGPLFFYVLELSLCIKARRLGKFRFDCVLPLAIP
jgi:hypothetical protein